MQGTKTYYRFTKLEAKDEDKMPTLKVEVLLTKGEWKTESWGMVFDPSEEECVLDTGYLSPFRGYKFQVSGTETGSGDQGSSKVIGLANIEYMNTLSASFSPYCSNLGRKDAIRELFKGQALIALNDFEAAKITRTEMETLTSFCEDCVDYINAVCGKYAA